LLGHRLALFEGRRVIKGGTSKQAFDEFMEKMKEVKSGIIKFEDV
jgi:hypothetical protein